MSLFSIPNAVLLALVQVGLVIIGTLGAGAGWRYRTDLHLPVPFQTAVLTEWGLWLLLVPLFWLTAVLLIRRSATIGDGAKVLAFWSGVVLIFALVAFAVPAAGKPWLVELSSTAALEPP